MACGSVGRSARPSARPPRRYAEDRTGGRHASAYRHAGGTTIPKKWIAGFTAALVCCHPAVAAEPLIGRASVIDGDTIGIAGARIRLHGVDAPESWQKCEDGDGATYQCGRAAAAALDQFLAASRPTRCELVERDRYDRLVSVCLRADGRDVNRWLVESGNAVDWVRYSKGAYATAQEDARVRGIGIWRGRFLLPCQARGRGQSMRRLANPNEMLLVAIRRDKEGQVAVSKGKVTAIESSLKAKGCK